MVEQKYFIIVTIIVCLLALYYFYSEINSIKKIFLPTYQKTMALEAKITELEKMSVIGAAPNKNVSKIDSPAMSVSYCSDMIKNGNLSIKYADLTETEANELLKNIEKYKPIVSQSPLTLDEITPKKMNDIQNKSPTSNLTTSIPNPNIALGELSDVPITSDSLSNEPFNYESDTFDMNIGKLINKDNFITPEKNLSKQKMENDNAILKNASESIKNQSLLSIDDSVTEDFVINNKNISNITK